MKKIRLCKKDIIMLSIVVLFMIMHFMTVYYEAAYIKKREACGNERWKEVEQRIIQVEDKILLLEEELNYGRDS